MLDELIVRQDVVIKDFLNLRHGVAFFIAFFASNVEICGIFVPKQPVSPLLLDLEQLRLGQLLLGCRNN